MLIHEATPVRDEGTVIVFEGVHETSQATDLVWFGVDARMAAEAAEHGAVGAAVYVEEWQILGRAVIAEHPDPGPGHVLPEDGDPAAAERSYEQHLGRT